LRIHLRMPSCDHVGQESFINALNDGPLQMEVMKGEPSNLEAALNHATKIESSLKVPCVGN